MKWERIVFLKKKINTPPPPPKFFVYNKFFNVGNSMKTWRKHEILNKQKNIILNFFQFLKNSSKIQTTFNQYKKLYSTPPWPGAHTCKVLRKYSYAFLSYSSKTKRDGRMDGCTDVQGALQYLPSPGLWRDGRTGGVAISPIPGPTVGDKNTLYSINFLYIEVQWT